ncbi:hypothetical protein H8N01_28355 [Streptomyces sp. AC536]|uniref:hypothetical protein n=1 Tax=Streptomyces buecherae TaxID=2763006 RepID=UPI00164D8CCF|nr:hypothetical protein [Streptomyces buecherae]MBC3986386.1 hypothetical protein [Streptomyces buecherae]QNJ41477.1 hypothetical protein H7H31_18020 [Streptomyces buecherae]
MITDQRAQLITVGPWWPAVTVPEDWGVLMAEALAGASGPAFHEPGLRYLVYLVPGQAEGWPDAEAAGVSVVRAGDPLLVPHVDGTFVGLQRFHWLASLMKPLASPARLREAIEATVGPLEHAGGKGPVRVCCECGSPTRAAVLVDVFVPMSSSPREWYACAACWNRWQRGQKARHLRAVPGAAAQ